MAVAVVGDALLSASVRLLLDKISSREILDFFRSRKLDVSLLRKLTTTLRSLRAVLNDAEEKQFTNPDVKEWLDELTQAVFDADDLLDEINTEALQCKVEEAEYQSQSFSAKVWKGLSSRFKRSDGEINSKIQTLLEGLELFARQIRILQLKRVSSSVWHGTPASSVEDESAIYGRDDEKMKLEKYLLSGDSSGSGSKIGVIAIVGMGGVGKTTLAKLLYNDDEVKQMFELRAWACVPKDFDVVRVTETLLKSVTSKAIDTDDLDTLQVKLQQSLSRKRFLLVLDDIWGAKYTDWDNLMKIFNAGEWGSKIIVTTRHESVAKRMQAFTLCHLKSLDSEVCWSLLAKHAGANSRSDLEGIGREIAKKCDGLPLAAVELGGLLGTELSKDHWNKVLKRNIWDLTNEVVQPSLLLSYHFLPAPLKRCFAYCAIFPKNSKFKKEMVVQLWIAEGLVHVSRIEKSMEELGDEYFDELVSRSLICRRLVDREEYFEMHDLINDLATTISTTYCIRYEDPKALKNLNKIRYLSYNRGSYDNFNMFESFDGLKGLRTFLGLTLHGRGQWSSSYISNKAVHDLLQELKQLRVLSLSHYENITELPNSIGNLKHLRHLDLSRTGIKRLPPATCKLYSLLTFLLSDCKHLTELPEEMGKLVNLCHLDISGTNVERLPPTTCKLYNLRTLLLSYCRCLTELPEEMGKLKNLRHLDIIGTPLQEMPIQIAELEDLQTLTSFVVSEQQNGLKVGELRKFPHLRGKLWISKLQNVTDPHNASQANLKEKEQIEELSLQWGYDTAEDSQLLVLAHLQPSTNLKNLTIEFYGGTGFPDWLGDPSFGNMVYLRIHGCHRCSSLPPVGQLPSLKTLEISDMISVKTVGSEFYGCSSPSFQPFPSLESLWFEDMPEWEEWNLMEGTTTEFPRLSYLSLINCPKLKGSLTRNLPCSPLKSRSSGEALLSASVQVLLDKISSEISEFFRSKKLDVSLLEKLKLALLSLQPVLNDAEEKQITNSAVKKWLDGLTQAVFDADNLLDEINTEALRCKLEETEEAEYQRQSVGGNLQKVLSSPFKRPYGEINSKIQTLLGRLESFPQQIHMLQLKGVSSSVWHGTPSIRWHQQVSSSKSKAGDFPGTESEAGESPKMEVKPLDDYIFKTDPLVLNASGQGLTEPLNTDLWRNALRIELANNKFSELPLPPDCLGLEVLMLQGNADLTKIPSSFFVHMPLLRILDLSYTSVRELPCSLFSLEQLRELYLKGCECFMELPPAIGNLQKLEKLDLDETQITHLPEEAQKLTNMQSLTLYFYEYRSKKNMQYSRSTIIPSGVISKLERLKHLSIGVNPDDERWHENVQVILPEILGLECLQSLSIYIPQLDLLKLILPHIFEVDFRFIVGFHMQRIISGIPPAVDVKFKQSDRSLKFVKGTGVPAEIKMLLRHSKALLLERHITIKNLSEFEMKNLEQLRVCILAECKEMQTIVGGGDSNRNDDMLSCLLFLSISHMKNLRSICEGPTLPRCLFGMLQSLSLQSCPKLITLFSLDFLGNLSSLKELIVKDCPKLSTLISHESSKCNADTFLPTLRKLSLLHLPELTSISSGLQIGPGLKEIAFYGCPKLLSLSSKELSSQELTVIKGETNWWKAQKDRPSEFDQIFSPIHEQADLMTQLGIYDDDDIDNCPGGSAVKAVPVTIFNPEGSKIKMTNMPEWEEWNLMRSTATEFPRLSDPSLSNCPKFKGSLPSNLPSLTRFHLSERSPLESPSSGEADDGNITRLSNLFSGSMLGLNSLQALHIYRIPSLTAFPRDGLPKRLRELSIVDCENLEFPPHESLHSYKALEKLRILNSCCSLTSFPLGSLPVLKWLSLLGCKSLRSISISEEEDASHCLTSLQEFDIRGCDELRSFSLRELPAPNLKCFRVSRCNKLNSLPEPINKLAGLQELAIHGLPQLQSFAKEGLPISLQKLQVRFHEQIFSNMDIAKWGLEQLTCLSELEIGGDRLVKMLMEMEVPLLPSSLVSLRICNAFDITHLEGKCLHHLTSLKSLEIFSCYCLESLPKGLPSSLKRLEISFCRNLESLPKELPSSLESLKLSFCERLKSLPKGLPSSSLVLTIDHCPLLEASCWSKGDIPYIIINE